MGRGKGFSAPKGHRLVWPANSPDLNPLDFAVWSEWDRLIDRAAVGNSQVALKAEVMRAWTVLQESGFVQRAIQSWPKRLRACVEQGGGAFEHTL